MPKISNILSEDELENSLYQYALSILAKRDYSTDELLRKLQVKLNNLKQTSKNNDTTIAETAYDPIGYGNYKTVFNNIIHKLRGYGYVDDARYADAFVRYKCKTLGARRIRQELNQKGISEELINAAMQQLISENHSEEAIRAVWDKKFGCLPKGAKEKAKQIRFLSYRGFNFTQINDLFSRLGEEVE